MARLAHFASWTFLLAVIFGVGCFGCYQQPLESCLHRANSRLGNCVQLLRGASMEADEAFDSCNSQRVRETDVCFARHEGEQR